jgi:hypothetical protein
MRVFDIGFSPCPNDTFIFDALVNHKIDTQGFEPYVLMGLGKYLQTISYIEVEFLFENYFLNNKSGFFYVEEILNKKFKLISLKKIVRNSSNRILWIDALYENKNKRIY